VSESPFILAHAEVGVPVRGIAMADLGQKNENAPTELPVADFRGRLSANRGF